MNDTLFWLNLIFGFSLAMVGIVSDNIFVFVVGCSMMINANTINEVSRLREWE